MKLSMTASLLALLLLTVPAASRSAEGAAAPAATTDIAGLKVDASGCIGLDHIQLFLLHNDQKWARTTQSTAVLEPSKTEDGATIFRGAFTAGGSKVLFEESVKPLEKNHYKITYKVTLPADLTTNLLAIAFELPVADTKGKQLTYDGNSLVLPETLGEKWHLVATKASDVTVPTQAGTFTIKGAFAFNVQDKRQWKKDLFEVHCGFPAGQTDPSGGGTIRELVLDVTVNP